jgi:hypothetical protein
VVRGIEHDNGLNQEPPRRRRARLVVAGLAACVLFSLAAMAIHQNAGRPLALAAPPAPAPPVVPVLLPDGTAVPATTATTPTTATPATTGVPNTVPVAPPAVAPPAVVSPVVAVPAAPPGRYAFEVTNPDGNPARWNPCVAVHYVVNLTGAPAGALADLQRAFAILSAASGLQFVSDGATTAALKMSWVTSGPVGPSGWPDVLVGWSDPDHTDLSLTAGMGGITQYEAASLPGGGSALVDAVVVLSAPNDPGSGFGPNARGGLLLHELGHAVGLAHVNDRTQIMNPISTGAAGVYGTGDLAGLRILGSGSCLTAPTRSQTNLGSGG